MLATVCGEQMSANHRWSSSHTSVVPFGDRFGVPSAQTVAWKPSRCSRTTRCMSSVRIPIGGPPCRPRYADAPGVTSRPRIDCEAAERPCWRDVDRHHRGPPSARRDRVRLPRQAPVPRRRPRPPGDPGRAQRVVLQGGRRPRLARPPRPRGPRRLRLRARGDGRRRRGARPRPGPRRLRPDAHHERGARRRRHRRRQSPPPARPRRRLDARCHRPRRGRDEQWRDAVGIRRHRPRRRAGRRDPRAGRRRRGGHRCQGIRRHGRRARRTSTPPAAPGA